MDELQKVGFDMIEEIKAQVAKIPKEERGLIIKEKQGDETSKIDQVAEDAAFQALERASKRLGIRFHVYSEEQESVKEIGQGKLKVFTILDPLDGSMNAISDIPFYSCIIAFTEPTEKDEVSIGDFKHGFVGDLVHDRVFHSDGKVAMLNTERIFCSDETDPMRSRIILDSNTYKYDGAKSREVYESRFMPLRLGFLDYGRLYGAGLELITLVAQKGIKPAYTAYLCPFQKLDNIVGPKVIIEAAGGIVTDWENKPLDDHDMSSRPDVIFSANKKIHEFILNRIRSH